MPFGGIFGGKTKTQRCSSANSFACWIAFNCRRTSKFEPPTANPNSRPNCTSSMCNSHPVGSRSRISPMSLSAASLSVVRVIRDKVVIASGVASPPRALAPLSERAAIFAVSRGCPASRVGRARTSSWPFPKNTVARLHLDRLDEIVAHRPGPGIVEAARDREWQKTLTENGLGPDADAPSKRQVQYCGEDRNVGLLLRPIAGAEPRAVAAMQSEGGTPTRLVREEER